MKFGDILFNELTILNALKDFKTFKTGHVSGTQNVCRN